MSSGEYRERFDGVIATSAFTPSISSFRCPRIESAVPLAVFLIFGLQPVRTHTASTSAASLKMLDRKLWLSGTFGIACAGNASNL
jgi:hypothetical protein